MHPNAPTVSLQSRTEQFSALGDLLQARVAELEEKLRQGGELYLLCEARVAELEAERDKARRQYYTEAQTRIAAEKRMAELEQRIRVLCDELRTSNQYSRGLEEDRSLCIEAEAAQMLAAQARVAELESRVEKRAEQADSQFQEAESLRTRVAQARAELEKAKARSFTTELHQCIDRALELLR